tara:strand:+ start:375 stop:1031 length:657 start_codon:yes stop_codon:yes gene_type:complete
MTNKKNFWNNKIIEWENDRYYDLNKINAQKLDSVKCRLDVCEKILSRIVKNKNIVEIGCGSGLLAKKLIEKGAKSYAGYDFAKNAIIRAKKNNKNNSKIKFYTREVLQIKKIKKCDIIFSLGLIDWMNEKELRHLSKLSKNKYWLHSFSEKRLSIFQFIHKIYVTLYYGLTNGMYIPRYDNKSKIKNLFGNNKIKFIENKKLSFGVIAYCFNYVKKRG